MTFGCRKVGVKWHILFWKDSSQSRSLIGTITVKVYDHSLSRTALCILWPRPKCGAQDIGSCQKYAICATPDHARLRSAPLRFTSKCYLHKPGPSHELVPSTCIHLVQQQMQF